MVMGGYTNSFSVGNKKFNQPVVGDVITDKAKLDIISACFFAKRVSICYGEPFCLCSLMRAPFGCCLSNGQRVRFKHLYDGYHVTWVCSKLKEFSELEK
jgi:hypothetical protein